MKRSYAAVAASPGAGRRRAASCPDCTFRNDPGAQFCEVCGAQLVERSSSCPRCTLENTEIAQSCRACNLPLSRTKDEEDAAAPLLACPRCAVENIKGARQCIACELMLSPSTLPATDNALVRMTLDAGEDTKARSDGLIRKLQGKLAAQGGQVHLCSGFTSHFSQQNDGFSCGYRNIQMLCSALLCIPHIKGVLFDGAGIVPTYPVLQHWIERAWAKGYDGQGCADFGGRLVGTRAWIGAGEVAALLCSFGIDAELIDFLSPAARRWNEAKKAKIMAATNGQGATRGSRQTSILAYVSSHSRFASEEEKDARKDARPAPADKLFEFIHSYFTEPWGGENWSELRPPLFLQHRGHSRTVVGVEARNGMQNLIVFDPSQSSSKLCEVLAKPGGWWGRSFRRSVSSLKYAEYQVVKVNFPLLEDVANQRAKVLSSREIVLA